MWEQDLAGIVERASTLDERLGGDFVSAEGEDTGLVDARLEAWSWALGKGDRDRFRQRLAWDGLDPEAVRPILGRVRLREGTALPEWSELLAEALRLAPPERREGTDEAWPAQMAFLEAEHPLPFEEVLAPFVLVACERLAKRTAAFGGLLSEAAPRAALERDLLRSLSPLSAKLLLTEFETMRAQEQSSWDRLFSLAREPEGRSLYRQFVRRLAEGSWRACSCSIRCWHVSWARSHTTGSRRTLSSSDGWRPTCPSSSASSAARSLATSSSSNHRCRIRTAAGAASWR
jgi:hypothetical protein